MPLPYRTILLLPQQTNLVQLLEQEMEAWLVRKKKVSSDLRVGFINGSFFTPGVHQLSPGRTLSVARRESSDGSSRSLLMRLTEASESGTWQVDAIAVDATDSGKHRDQLLIESARTDDTSEDWSAAPPGLVSQLLGRESVLDGATPVTAHPRLIRSDQIDEVRRAILDDMRSISVIVAVSEGPQYDEGWRAAVAELTARLIGTSAVFVVSPEGAAVLNASLPATHHLKAGLVRTYLPNVDLADPTDGLRHRFLGPRTLNRGLRKNHKGELKASPFLQEAFAVQTRVPQLAVALPNALRRHRQALIDDLGDSTFAANVDRLIAEQRAADRGPDRIEDGTAPHAESPSPTISAGTGPGLAKRLKQLISKWLRRSPAEIGFEDLDALDDHLERSRLTTKELRRERKEIRSNLADLTEGHEELIEAYDFRGLELVDAEKSVDKLNREVQRLRRELTDAGRAALAYATPHDDLWRTPDSLEELALTLMPDASDHEVIRYVVFTGDLGRVSEAERRDVNGLYVQRCWDFVRVLYEYAELCATGIGPSNIHAYLESGDCKTPVSVSRHARGETEQTMNQWGRERVFKVPTDVSADGSATMVAHFKVDQRDSFAPRMHYLDDTANTGKIYVGYIGRHLTNTKTKNA